MVSDQFKSLSSGVFDVEYTLKFLPPYVSPLSTATSNGTPALIEAVTPVDEVQYESSDNEEPLGSENELPAEAYLLVT